MLHKPVKHKMFDVCMRENFPQMITMMVMDISENILYKDEKGKKTTSLKQTKQNVNLGSPSDSG